MNLKAIGSVRNAAIGRPMGFIEEFKRAYAGDDTQHYERLVPSETRSNRPRSSARRTSSHAQRMRDLQHTVLLGGTAGAARWQLHTTAARTDREAGDAYSRADVRSGR